MRTAQQSFIIASAAVAILVGLFAFALTKPSVKRPYHVTQTERQRQGWTDQKADIHLDGTKKVPLYGEPNQSGFRDGMSLYLPAGEYDVFAHLEYEMERGEIWFLFDFGGAKQGEGAASGADIVGRPEWASIDWRFGSVKCMRPAGHACVILVSSKSTAPAMVLSKSRLFVWGVRDEDRRTLPDGDSADGVACNPPGKIAVVDGKLTCAYYFDGNYGAQ